VPALSTLVLAPTRSRVDLPKTVRVAGRAEGAARPHAVSVSDRGDRGPSGRHEPIAPRRPAGRPLPELCGNYGAAPGESPALSDRPVWGACVPHAHRHRRPVDDRDRLEHRARRIELAIAALRDRAVYRHAVTGTTPPPLDRATGRHRRLRAVDFSPRELRTDASTPRAGGRTGMGRGDHPTAGARRGQRAGRVGRRSRSGPGTGCRPRRTPSAPPWRAPCRRRRPAAPRSDRRERDLSAALPWGATAVASGTNPWHHR